MNLYRINAAIDRLQFSVSELRKRMEEYKRNELPEDQTLVAGLRRTIEQQEDAVRDRNIMNAALQDRIRSLEEDAERSREQLDRNIIIRRMELEQARAQTPSNDTVEALRKSIINQSNKMYDQHREIKRLITTVHRLRGEIMAMNNK